MWATIISSVFVALSYFNVSPSCSRQENNNTEIVVTKTADDIQKAEITPEQSTPDEIKYSKFWEQTGLWTMIKLPYVKHKKMNYIKILWNSSALACIILLNYSTLMYFGLSAIILLPIYFILEKFFDKDASPERIVYIAQFLFIGLPFILTYFGVY